MEINQKMLLDLASQLGIGSADQAPSDIAGMEAVLRNKSEDQLLAEIMELKEELKRDPRLYGKQMQALNVMGSMMKGEQRRRFERILKLLE